MAWSPDALAWPMAASLLCAPVVYPWYPLWQLPFLRSASMPPIIIWTVSIIPTYCVWHLRAVEGSVLISISSSVNGFLIGNRPK